MPQQDTQITPARLVTNGILRAARDLGLNGGTLARITGLSEATVSRLRRGSWCLHEGSKSYEIAMALVHVHHRLRAVMGGNLDRMKTWLHAQNDELGHAPAALLERVQGLFRVLAHLEHLRPGHPG